MSKNNIKELAELVGNYVILDADYASDDFAVSLWTGVAPTACWVGKVIKILRHDCILVHWAKPHLDKCEWGQGPLVRFFVMPTSAGKEWRTYYHFSKGEDGALARFSDFTDDKRVPSWAIEAARRIAIQRLSN